MGFGVEERVGPLNSCGGRGPCGLLRIVRRSAFGLLVISRCSLQPRASVCCPTERGRCDDPGSESRPRPGQGIVTVRTRGLNQRDEVVIEFERTIMMPLG